MTYIEIFCFFQDIHVFSLLLRFLLPLYLVLVAFKLFDSFLFPVFYS